MKNPTPLALIFGVSLAFLISFDLGAAEPMVVDKVNWADFLSRHDLVWDMIPSGMGNSPIIGNGGVSASITKDTSKAAISWKVYRIDVTDHRMPADQRPDPLFDTCRLSIGRFDLQPVGKIISTSMRVVLWDAVCTGEIKTDKGRISWRSFVPHDKDVIVVEFDTEGEESGFTFTWVPFPSSSPRLLGKRENLKHMSPEKLAQQTPDPVIDNYQLNPDPTVVVTGDLMVSHHPLRAGGEFAVACRTEQLGESKRVYRIAIEPVSDNAPALATETVKDATPVDTLFTGHIKWWHDFYPVSFLSIPDTRLESHYWIQNYKLASLTRPGNPPIDVYGYGMPDVMAGWPNIWWNMNVQENYYGCFEGNHLDLGESLSGSLERFADNLSKNIPVPDWQADSAWIGRDSDQQLRTEVKMAVNPDGKSVDCKDVELADLIWAMELYHRQCRYAADDVRLKNKFLPLLEKCVNFYRHVMTKGPDGKWHTPVATSPEIGTDSDLNYDLGALRWALATLISEYTRLGLQTPQMKEWKQLQADLVDFPIGPNGLKIGANRELIFSHRHYSHLLAIYPLYVLDWDNPDQRDLMKKSVDHWWGLFTDPTKKREEFFGYSQTGAASMFASMGRGDDALAALEGYLHFNATLAACYQEGTVEVPFSVSQSTQEMMLQSRKGLIRIFPAMPSTWKDAVFRDLRTEGAFLVSGRWKNGQTDWVRVKSLAGEPCRIRIHLEGPIKAIGPATPQKTGEDEFDLPLKKGEEAILYCGDAVPDLVIEPLEGDPAARNSFGGTQAMIAQKLKASVKLAPNFKRGMTLPAEQPILVEGTTAPGSRVIVSFDSRGLATTADADGNWKVTLDPVHANDKPSKLIISGQENHLSIDDILVK